MKAKRGFIAADYFVQATLGVILIILGLGGLMTYGSTFVAFFILQAVFGFWQVLSAVVILISKGDKNRGYYLLMVLLFFFLAIPSSELVRNEEIFLIFWVLIPLCFAIIYFMITARDYYDPQYTQPKTDARGLEDILDSDVLLNQDR